MAGTTRFSGGFSGGFSGSRFSGPSRQPGFSDERLAAAVHLAFAPLRRVINAPKLDADNWWRDHANVGLLVRWAESEGFTPRELSRLAAKPWGWRVEFVCAWCRTVDGKGSGGGGGMPPRGRAA